MYNKKYDWNDSANIFLHNKTKRNKTKNKTRYNLVASNEEIFRPIFGGNMTSTMISDDET